jgi:hypothetical protein
MVQRLDGAFTSSHHLANLRIGHSFDKLKDQQILSFGREPANGG